MGNRRLRFFVAGAVGFASATHPRTHAGTRPQMIWRCPAITVTAHGARRTAHGAGAIPITIAIAIAIAVAVAVAMAMAMAVVAMAMVGQ